jgi:protein-tyrosine phosphatase
VLPTRPPLSSLAIFLSGQGSHSVTFMNLYWITAVGVRVAIAARPRGDDWLSDDVQWLRKAGVDVLASALTLPEVEELGLSGEADSCRSSGIEFLSFPVEDRSVPASLNEFKTLLDHLNESLVKGKRVAIHCRAGVGRSSLIVACLLVRNGLSAEAAFLAIEKARGTPVPDTPDQRRWVERYAPERSQ